MDPRHQSQAQEALNKIVTLINRYMQDQPESVLESEGLLTVMRHLSRYVYEYAGLEVDVDGIISRKNMFSIDVVQLPLIDELFGHDQEAFERLRHAIRDMLQNDKFVNGLPFTLEVLIIMR